MEIYISYGRVYNRDDSPAELIVDNVSVREVDEAVTTVSAARVASIIKAIVEELNA